MEDRAYLPFVLVGLITVIIFLLLLPLRRRSIRALPWAIAAALLAVGSFVTLVNAAGWSTRLGIAWFPWIEKAGLLQCALGLYSTRIAYRRGRASGLATMPSQVPGPATREDGS
jgi:hypothetical protein